jgi:hypothetical protein
MNDLTSDCNNIFFVLEEKPLNNNELVCKEENIQDILSELDEISVNNNLINNLSNNLSNDLSNDFLNYYNSELYYNGCTVKDLLRICQYYEIDKNIKSAKCKKQDIIATIIYFENEPENYYIVEKRNKMWKYIYALKDDNKMKKYIIWN